MTARWIVTLVLLGLGGPGCGAAASSPDTTRPQREPTATTGGDGESDATHGAQTEAVEVDPDAEPHSMHHTLRLQNGDYVGASVEVRVDEVPDHGLRFFALQVDFSDVAWAHGGLQGGPDEPKANWGGLVSGIDYDYAGAEQEVLAAIQNEPGRTSGVRWTPGTWYRYEVSRGELEELPPGDYAVLDEEPVTVAEPRQMWRWTFTVTAVDSNEVVWTHDLFVAHPLITAATYWTETGYGIDCTDKLTVQWRNPLMHRDDGAEVLPFDMRKSMAQSTCPSQSTTDMAAVDNGGKWGTIQWYGVERPESSRDGDLLYDFRRDP